MERKAVPPTAAALNDEPPTLTRAQGDALKEIAGVLSGASPGDDGRQTTDDRTRLYIGSPDSTEPAPVVIQIQTQTSATQNGEVFLLHGVTGSGKTEIYLRAIGMALRKKRQALVLVPEISLTPQAVHRFASRFPGRVALVHSQLPPGQQFDEWRRSTRGTPTSSWGRGRRYSRPCRDWGW